jgi:hypothetical protein
MAHGKNPTFVINAWHIFRGREPMGSISDSDIIVQKYSHFCMIFL